MAYHLQKFTTETGAQEIIPIEPDHRVTIRVIGGESETRDIVDVDAILDDRGVDSPIRAALSTNVFGVTNPYVRSLEGAIAGIGLTIHENNSKDIKLEILTALV